MKEEIKMTVLTTRISTTTNTRTQIQPTRMSGSATTTSNRGVELSPITKSPNFAVDIASLEIPDSTKLTATQPQEGSSGNTEREDSTRKITFQLPTTGMEESRNRQAQTPIISSIQQNPNSRRKPNERGGVEGRGPGELNVISRILSKVANNQQNLTTGILRLEKKLWYTQLLGAITIGGLFFHLFISYMTKNKS
tara:strand:+ start:1635 stop:2219 length:585 start_codon:yes stop_codon:yes gene_type:complete